MEDFSIWLRKRKRQINYAYKCLMDNKSYEPLSVDIDVVIPMITKDIPILPLCIEGLKHSVNHSINNIYVVAPDVNEIRDICDREKLLFVNETQVLGFAPSDINFFAGEPKINRSGWIFQQLLKLSGNITEKRYFLVIDADHILLQPHSFITKEKKLVFYQSIQYHEPYYKNMYELMGYYPQNSLSYVAHKMIFDKESLESLHRKIEERNGKLWYNSIVEKLDSKEISAFSEYELYGTFIPENSKVLIPWKNKSLKYSRLEDYNYLKNKYGDSYRAITFPNFMNL